MIKEFILIMIICILLCVVIIGCVKEERIRPPEKKFNVQYLIDNTGLCYAVKSQWTGHVYIDIFTHIPCTKQVLENINGQL